MGEFTEFLINKMKSSLEPEDLQILTGSKTCLKQVETIKEEPTYKTSSLNGSFTDFSHSESSKTRRSTRKLALRHKIANSKKKRYSSGKSKTYNSVRSSNKWRTYNITQKSPVFTDTTHLPRDDDIENSDSIVNNPIYQSDYMGLTVTKKVIYKSLEKPSEKSVIKIPKSKSSASSSAKSSESNMKTKYKSRELIMSSWNLILKKAADDPKNLKKIYDEKLSQKSSKSKDPNSSKTSKTLDLSITRPDEIVKSFFSYLNNYGDDGCTIKTNLNKSNKEKSSSFIKINSFFPMFKKNQTKSDLSDKSINVSKHSDKSISNYKLKPETKSGPEQRGKFSLNCCGNKLTDSNFTIESKHSLKTDEDIDLDRLIEKLGNNDEKLEQLKNKLSVIIKSRKNQNFYFAISPQHKMVKNDNFLKGLCKHLNSSHLPASSTPNPELLLQNFSASDSLSKNNYFFKENSEQCLLSSIEKSRESFKNNTNKNVFNTFFKQKKYADGKIYEKEFRKILVQPIDVNVMAPQSRHQHQHHHYHNEKRNLKKIKQQQCPKHTNKQSAQVNSKRPRVKSSKQILKEISEKCKDTREIEVVQPINSFTNYYYYEDNLLKKENQRHKTNKVKTKRIKSLLGNQNENIYNDPAKTRFLY